MPPPSSEGPSPAELETGRLLFAGECGFAAGAETHDRIPLPELPFGLRIENLEPAAEGLVVTGSAAAPVFRRT